MELMRNYYPLHFRVVEWEDSASSSSSSPSPEDSNSTSLQTSEKTKPHEKIGTINSNANSESSSSGISETDNSGDEDFTVQKPLSTNKSSYQKTRSSGSILQHGLGEESDSDSYFSFEITESDPEEDLPPKKGKSRKLPLVGDDYQAVVPEVCSSPDALTFSGFIDTLEWQPGMIPEDECKELLLDTPSHGS